jgi:hypothetical protein
VDSDAIHLLASLFLIPPDAALSHVPAKEQRRARKQLLLLEDVRSLNWVLAASHLRKEFNHRNSLNKILEY